LKFTAQPENIFTSPGISKFFIDNYDFFIDDYDFSIDNSNSNSITTNRYCYSLVWTGIPHDLAGLASESST
jgi:hypothetical protein